MKSSLVRNVAAGFVLALPILLVIAVVQHRSVLRAVAFYQGAARAEELRRELDATFSLLKDAEAAAWDYMRSGEAAYLDRFQVARAGFRDSTQRLQKLGADNPRHEERLRTLEALAASRAELLQQAIDSRPHKFVDARGQKPFSADRQKIMETQGQKLIDDISAIVAEVNAEEEARRKYRKDEAQASVRRATNAITFGNALAMWLVAVGALLLYRKTAEQKWAGVERRVHGRLLETMPVGVCLTDESGIILYTNPAEDALLGYKKGELLGRHVTALGSQMAEENARTVEDVFEKSENEGTWRGEFMVRKKDGTNFVSYARASSMEMPGKHYRVLVQEDITDRKRI